MRERPILFSGEMVRAILEGKKTQTRRVIKPQSLLDTHTRVTACYECPYGAPGDRLWVRETWALVPRTAYAGSTGVQQTLRPDDNHDAAIYRAGWDRVPPGQWRPSIFMPRWASRITLEVVNVRVERIQDISYEDCCRETGASLKWEGEGEEPYKRDMLGAFAFLWNEINAKRGYSFRSNPWVWVIDFTRIEV